MAAADVEGLVAAENQLNARLVQYAGKWVAVVDYEIVHAADTWDELLELLSEGEREDARVLRVPEHLEAINLF